MLPIKQTTPIASQPPRSINHEDQRKPRWRAASQPASSPVSAAREEEDLRPFAFSDLSFCGQRGNRVFRQLKVAQREKLQKGPGLGMHAFIYSFMHTCVAKLASKQCFDLSVCSSRGPGKLTP